MDQVVIVKDAPKAPEGHEQAMIDKVDQSLQNSIRDSEGVTPSQPTDGRPQWLPEKFKSPEDLAKAYAELESKLGANQKAETKVEPQAVDSKETPQGSESVQTEEQAKNTLAEKGLDLQKYNLEFAESGGLSESSYQELQQSGIPKEMVDAYIRGRQAEAAQYEEVVTAEVGGSEQYQNMISWAAANLAAEDIAEYNSAVSSGSLARAKLAAAGLALKYTQANGSPPKVTLGGNTSGSSSDVFESISQVTAAMGDPRYRTDPAYRAKVQSKLARSNVL